MYVPPGFKGLIEGGLCLLEVGIALENLQILHNQVSSR